MHVRNGRAKLTIDPRTGSILRLEDCITGRAHIDACREGRDDGRLFRIVTPADSWWSCTADSHEQTQVECTTTPGGVCIRYPSLLAGDGAHTGVDVRVDIRTSAAPDEILLTMQVTNRGPRTLLDTTFPLVGGWFEQGGRGRDRIAIGANSFVEPRMFPTQAGNTYARNHQRAAWSYPVHLACPWVDVSGPAGGFSYLNYMPEGLNGQFWMENLAGYGDDFRLQMGWAHLVAVRPGGSWTSPTMALAVHDGDWRDTADRYRTWFDARHPPDYSRPAVRSRIGFQNVFFRGFDGTPIRPLDAIPQAAKAGRRYGIDALCVWDMLTLGNYARHDPHDLTDYSPGERATIQHGLRQAEAAGTKTCALINFRHPNAGLHLPDTRLADRVQRRFTGTFRTENWTANHTTGAIWSHHIGPESYVFSPFSADHRERVLQLTRDYLDMGYSSMFYDQPFESQPDYGLLDDGCAPETTHHRAVDLVAAVRELLLTNDRDAVVIGEECDILATPQIDQWMSWSIAAPSPRLTERLTMMRYAMPHTILSWVVDHEPERAALAFAFGMQLCLMVHGAEGTLEDEPAFGERLLALKSLRRATAERTVLARFAGQRGLILDSDGGLTACAYDSPAGPAVVLAATDAGARATVEVDRDSFACPGGESAGTVCYLDGTRTVQRDETCELTLGKGEVAVWML